MIFQSALAFAFEYLVVASASMDYLSALAFGNLSQSVAAVVRLAAVASRSVVASYHRNLSAADSFASFVAVVAATSYRCILGSPSFGDIDHQDSSCLVAY